MHTYLLAVVIGLIAVVFSVSTILLACYTGKKLLKYIPAAVSGIAALAFYLKANFFAQGFEDIGYMIMALIAVVVFTVSLITGIVMEFVGKRKKN